MTNENNIDVLTVMLSASEAAAVGDFEADAADLLDARNAVAELIEAAKEMDRYSLIVTSAISRDPENYRALAVNTSIHRLRAALAKVTP